MNRIARGVMVFVMLATLVTSLAVAQSTRGLMERKMWYVTEDGKVAEALYWRIVLGRYDLKLKRNFPGEGQIEVAATMNFMFLSSGYIEGNGHSAKGPVNSLPGMRIRVDGNAAEIKIDDIDYIYDWGTKVAAKDGRKGDFMIGAEQGNDLEVKQFGLSEFRMVKGKFGELELKEVKDRLPIVGIAFSKDAAIRASKEPKSDY